MNRGIYATASGMLATQKLMDTVANNLANASTTGFKQDGLAFGDAFQRALYANGGHGPYLGTLGTGATEIDAYTVFDVGAPITTGNSLDVAIQSRDGLFAVQTPQGIRYTRDGSFQLDGEGMLVTKDGHSVLDERQQPIQIPQGQPNIDSDGSVSVDGRPVGKIGIFKGQFAKIGGSLFAGSGTEAIDEPELTPKALESSNVNTVEAMIEMITAGRTFEMAQKSIQQQDDLAQKLIQSLQS